ncbi:sensor histidine kinase [Thermocrinis minervae]|uniref:histidine kinase n=1 Tax=Thermocrinis minervae TaxID=381751 RepID=A0A1M6SU49_9AQUI|nr:ATP-binding protein [Thermocrinis minervae]SHK48251.1 two-component system, OmpR family, phosphate regulon sensor histidine kinase PhoR [Thermocrinis minervae]
MLDLLEYLEEGYILLEHNGRVAYVNRYASKLGILRDNPIGKFYYEAINNLTLVSLLSELIQTKKKSETEIVLGEKTYRIKAFPSVQGFWIRIEDITRYVAYEKSKREFVANASHELRTPLSVILGILETLYEEENSQEKKALIEKAIRRAKAMQNLVEDLLILARLESREEKLILESIDLRQLVEEIFDMYTDFPVKLINSVQENYTLVADRKKLFTLLKNLVDNAVKYNKEEGLVEVKAYSDGTWHKIEVKDTGIGIPRVHLPFIFERFYRADPSRSRDLGGTGLGLSIVKHIALLHGGKVEVESKEGEGSLFRVYLPILSE